MISLSVISLGKSPFQMCSTNNLVIRTKWVLPPSSAAHVRRLPSTIHFRNLFFSFEMASSFIYKT